MHYESETKCNKGKQNKKKMGKEMMYWYDCLFKVGFNQIINKFSVIHN